MDPIDDPATKAPMDPTATRVFPAGGAIGGPQDEQAARWSASASVPAPGARRQAEVWVDEPVADPHAGRAWLTPVILGIVGLILFALLAAGLYLIVATDDEDAPTAPPSQPPPPAVTSAAPTVSRPPSSPPRPSSVAPAVTVVPTVVGVSEEEARQRLADAGLRVQVRRQTSSSAEPGTVLSSNPDVGTEVPQGSVVQLVVAVAPSPSASTPD
jgi:hypothetical protein